MDRVGLVDVRGHKVIEAAARPRHELLGRLRACRLQALDRGNILLLLGDGEVGPVPKALSSVFCCVSADDLTGVLTIHGGQTRSPTCSLYLKAFSGDTSSACPCSSHGAGRQRRRDNPAR